MSVEWGVFNSEGLLEGDLWTQDQAFASRDEFIEDGEEPDDLWVSEVCDCREHEQGDCPKDEDYDDVEEM